MLSTVMLTMLPWVAGVQRWQRGALGVGTVGWPLRSVTVRPCAWSLRGYRLQNAQHVCDGLDFAVPILDECVPVDIDPTGQKCEFVRVEIAILQTDGWPYGHLHRFS